MSQTRLLGFTFPGIDPADVQRLKAAKKKLEEGKEEPPPDPKIKIEPVSSTGVVTVKFN